MMDTHLPADEYPTFIFYQMITGIYTFLCVLWLINCALHRRQLLKIQFGIAFAIIIGLINEIVFSIKYEIVNRHGYKIVQE